MLSPKKHSSAWWIFRGLPKATKGPARELPTLLEADEHHQEKFCLSVDLLNCALLPNAPWQNENGGQL